jgi:hypothetical protein
LTAGEPSGFHPFVAHENARERWYLRRVIATPYPAPNLCVDPRSTGNEGSPLTSTHHFMVTLRT